jgi:hypothetical protein
MTGEIAEPTTYPRPVENSTACARTVDKPNAVSISSFRNGHLYDLVV